MEGVSGAVSQDQILWAAAYTSLKNLFFARLHSSLAHLSNVEWEKLSHEVRYAGL